MFIGNQEHPAHPTIETERTILRPHRLDDFDAYAAMWADPVVTRFIGGKPRTREESWIRFLRHPGMWSLLGYGFWAIEEKASGRFIGEAGFHDLKRDIVPSIEGMPEAGWALVPSAHGKGLASEVVGRMLAGATRLGHAKDGLHHRSGPSARSRGQNAATGKSCAPPITTGDDPVRDGSRRRGGRPA